MISTLQAKRRGRVKDKMPVPVGLNLFSSGEHGFLEAPHRKLLPVSPSDLGCGHSTFRGVLKKVHVLEWAYCCPKQYRRSVSEESSWRLETVKPTRSV